jgi:capsular exopolysaccharide synthesis family protein
MNKEYPTVTKRSHPGLFGSLNPQKIIILILRNWYVYLIALIFAGAAAVMYLRYKIPSYSVSTTILIEEDEGMPGQDILQGFTLRPGVQNLDNQLIILTSYSLIGKTLDQLNFGIDVYRKGLFSSASYYPMIPFRIEAGPGGLPNKIEFMFRHVHGDRFQLMTKTKRVPVLDSLFSFGKLIEYQGYSFTIYPQPELQNIYETGDKIFIRFLDREKLIEIYQNRLQVDLAARDGSIVQLSLEGTNRSKDIVFLSKLAEVYIGDNLEQKNAEAERIIAFIDSQLVGVKDSLRTTELELQQFRSRNRIMDVSAQAQQIVDQAVVLENQKAELNLRRNYYIYLDEYLADEGNESAPVSPSSMGIEDPQLAIHMQELAGLQAEYFSSGVGERNPLQGQLELRIRNSKQSIRETLNGIILANQMAIAENDQQLARLNSEAAGLPDKERQLLGFERRFNLNNVLYNYLLQERANAQIQSASNTPDNVLVDPARSSIDIVSPLWYIVFAFAFILAIGVPTIFILLGNVLQNKIATEDDLHFVSDIPVTGHIPHSRLSYNTVVLTEPASRIAEAFRSLRTRLEFFTMEASCPMLVISSSMPGEGKSFAAINLASAYSLAGKKTLLVGYDLRKPTIANNFELKDDVGITSYLIGKKSLKEVIHDTDFENLYVLPSGPIPPNPGELVNSSKAMEMFNLLKMQFEYIIVDSAPIGVVADIYPLVKKADSVLLLVRHGHTKKNVLSATIAELQDSGIEGFSLLLNDIKSKGGSYRYAYKYKYDYESKGKRKSA